MTDTNFNFKDFILEEKPEEAVQETKETNKQTTKPQVFYEVEWADHCDCIISRTTKKTKSWLVLFVSQGQFYIKDTDANITPLNISNFVSFFEKCEGDFPVNLNWVRTITKGKKANERFISILNNPLFQQLAKMDLVYQDTTGYWVRSFRPEEKDIPNLTFLLKVAKFISKDTKPSIPVKQKIQNTIFGGYSYASSIVQSGRLSTAQNYIIDLFFDTVYSEKRNVFQKENEYYGRDLLPRDKSITWYEPNGYSRYNRTNEAQVSSIDLLIEKFGESGTFHFIQSIFPQLPQGDAFNLSTSTFQLFQLLKNFDWKCDTFIEYLTWQPVVQGYNLNAFIQTWADTLKMQLIVYNEVRDKYPNSLASIHQKLSHQVSILEELQEEEIKARQSQEIKKRKEDLKKLLWNNKDEKYIITAPECTNDILEEASAMSNCLASYVERVANGSSHIFFLRQQKSPDEPLCDIEVVDNKITQALISRNRQPSVDIKDFIHRWAKKNNLIYNG